MMGLPADDNQVRNPSSPGWLEDLRTIGMELSALTIAALSMPLRSLLAPADEFDPRAPHPTPVVLVHGFLGDPTNFLVLRRFLVGRGVRNFVLFSYGLPLDLPRLALRLRHTIDAVRMVTGALRVDVIGHSLGGLIARRAVRRHRGVRRLVTLGAPYVGFANAPQELAIFGGSDRLVPCPHVVNGDAGCVVVPNCGHLGLLYAPAVMRQIAAYLTRGAETREDVDVQASRCGTKVVTLNAEHTGVTRGIRGRSDDARPWDRIPRRTAPH